MTNTLTIPLDLAERLDSPHSSVRNAALESLRRIIAAPVVERQEPVVYVSADAIEDADQVGMHATRAPNEVQTVPLYTKPAPVAVPDAVRNRLNEVWLFLDGQTELNSCTFGEKPEGRHQFWWRKELRTAIEDLNACLDKVKEMNQWLCKNLQGALVELQALGQAIEPTVDATGDPL